MPLKTREVGKTGVEAELRRVANEAKWFAPKFTSPANRSVPDRVCFKGLDGAIEYMDAITGYRLEHDVLEQWTRELIAQVIEMAECKAPGKKPTKKQQMMHERLHSLGINTVIIDSKEKAREYVRGE